MPTPRNHQIKGVLFDFDGTLTKPGAIDFGLIRKKLECPQDKPVLEYIQSLATAEQRRHAHSLLADFEIEAARASKPHEGAEVLVQKIIACGLPVGIITRNSRKCIQEALKNFSALDIKNFDPVLTRDDPLKPKPSGEGIRFAAQKWGLAPAEVLMVGDFVLDIQAGFDAGAMTVLLDNGLESAFPKLDGDFVIHHLDQLEDLIGLNRPNNRLQA
jgi:hydrogenase expression/formation protein HypE